MKPSVGGAGFCPSAVSLRVKMKPLGDRRIVLWFPLTKVPSWVPVCDPHPDKGLKQ